MPILDDPVSPDAELLLERARLGDALATDRLVALLYEELRRMAGRLMRGQRGGHTLQTTGLVHEAVVKLLQNGRERWPESSRHLLLIAGRAMKQVLVDHARGRARDKRRPPGQQVLLDDVLDEFEDRRLDLLALDEALARLEQHDPQAARLVTLRFFVGMTLEEAAEQLGLSLRSAEREWRAAKAWLRRAIDGRDGG